MTQWRWGTPKEYAYICSITGDSYTRRTLQFLDWENPQLAALARKELGRDNPRRTAADNKPSAQGSAIAEHEAQEERTDLAD